MMAPSVRPARVADAANMARVHVQGWQETYRGLMPDAALDAPELLAQRERFWTSVLTCGPSGGSQVAVAEQGGELVGIAMAGPHPQPDNGCEQELHLLYVLVAAHGTGAGQQLLVAVVDPGMSTGLWVVERNPRARAFYRKHGFVDEGTATVEDGVREVRMVRPGSPW